jgi:hypothetical protein
MAKKEYISRRIVRKELGVFSVIVPLLIILISFSNAIAGPNLIPTVPAPKFDYLCSCNLQGYVCSYVNRHYWIRESTVLGTAQYCNWVSLYPRSRKDMIFLMDDGWDMGDPDTNGTRGGLMLFAQRWPSYTSGSAQENLKKLSDTVKSNGWGGLGMWILAGQAPNYATTPDSAYWITRFGWMNYAGIKYWKVDWGNNAGNMTWRNNLSRLGWVYSPQTVVEQALVYDCISSCDAFRTYDIEALMSIPCTLYRIGVLLGYTASGKGKNVISCEDEPYMAASLGCSMGVMRHPFMGTNGDGNFPNGQQDYVFPPLNKNLKRCLDEVDRCALWHRIAPPYGIKRTVDTVDHATFTDSWYFLANEGWSTHNALSTQSAPQRIARGLPLPLVKTTSDTPYVVCSKNPNGAVSIGTYGRTFSTSSTNRRWVVPRTVITVQAGADSAIIGIFGRYGSLKLVFDKPLAGKSVLAQDILDTQSTDITSRVTISGDSLIIPGGVIDTIGLAKATPNDLSDPGMALRIVAATAVGKDRSTMIQRPFAGDVTLCAMGGTIKLPAGFSGKQTIASVYTLSGELISSSVVKNDKVSLIGNGKYVAQGMYIVRFKLSR